MLFWLHKIKEHQHIVTYQKQVQSEYIGTRTYEF